MPSQAEIPARLVDMQTEFGRDNFGIALSADGKPDPRSAEPDKPKKARRKTAAVDPAPAAVPADEAETKVDPALN